MEVTKRDMDLMKGLVKDFADHIRDINTILEARVSVGYMHFYELQKYKEAVTDLFIREVTKHILPGRFGDAIAPSQVQQGEIAQ